jgi:DNA transformation protein
MSAEQLIAHALDLFAPLGRGVVAKRMFGGLGFWSRVGFFAIGDPDEGRIYLKVDDLTRPAFEAAGGEPFTYRAKGGGIMVMSYFTPPDAALEDPEEMLQWAQLALEAAGRAAAAKGAKPRRGRAAKPASPSKPKPKPKSKSKSAPPLATRRATRRR